MIDKISRNYLEIKSLNDLNEVPKPSDKYSIHLVDPIDFQLNKFLYKQIGKKYFWKDRLNWSDQTWLEYVSNQNLYTYILKENEEIVGYFELIIHTSKVEAEIAYFGILEDYFNKGCGGYMLTKAIEKSFEIGAKRVWVHTCSLDHPNAIKNYISRGMKIFKTEVLERKAV